MMIICFSQNYIYMLHSVILKDVTGVLVHYSFPLMHFCFTSSNFTANSSTLIAYRSKYLCIIGSLWLVFFVKKNLHPSFFFIGSYAKDKPVIMVQ